jgi:hypothetical protein
VHNDASFDIQQYSIQLADLCPKLHLYHEDE